MQNMNTNKLIHNEMKALSDYLREILNPKYWTKVTTRPIF